MRYRLMATYRGAPYEAGIGPAEGAVVLFAACPPPEELGFEPATGHWRKELGIQDVQAVWQSRPVGTFRGDSCIVLDDLGDRLHIGYLGHDAFRAEQLGYWQVDRGVFELVAGRDEVTEIVEERTDYQPGIPPQAGYSALPPPADPGYARPAPGATSGYSLPAGRPEPRRTAPPEDGMARPPMAAERPLPLEAQAMRAASAASRRDQPAFPAGLAPAGRAEPVPGAGAIAGDGAGPSAEPGPGPGPGDGTGVAAGRGSAAGPVLASSPSEAAPYAAPDGSYSPDGSYPPEGQYSPADQYSPDGRYPANGFSTPGGSYSPGGPYSAGAYSPAGSYPPAETYSPGTGAMPGAGGAPGTVTLPRTTSLTGTAASLRTAASPGPATLPGPAAPGAATGRGMAPPATAPPATPAPGTPAPGTAALAAVGAPAVPASGPESPRRRRSAGRRMATERIFGELASLAAIPASSYSVGEEVDGAMCLLETAEGFEVFSSAGGARHEVRVFSDEESACFYLFGVLAADAVRTGVLVPGADRVPAATPVVSGMLGR